MGIVRNVGFWWGIKMGFLKVGFMGYMRFRRGYKMGLLRTMMRSFLPQLKVCIMKLMTRHPKVLRSIVMLCKVSHTTKLVSVPATQMELYLRMIVQQISLLLE